MKVINIFIVNWKMTHALLYVSMQTAYSFCSNIHFVNNTKLLLYINFDIKVLREANVILDIKIIMSYFFYLDQFHYIENILKKYNYFDYKIACISYDSNVKIFKNTRVLGIYEHHRKSRIILYL